MNKNGMPVIEITIPPSSLLEVCRIRKGVGSDDPYFTATTKTNEVPWLPDDVTPDAEHEWEQVRNMKVTHGLITLSYTLNLQEVLEQVGFNGTARYDYSNIFGDVKVEEPTPSANTPEPLPTSRLDTPTLPGNGPQPVVPPDINADMAKAPAGAAAVVESFSRPTPIDPAVLESFNLIKTELAKIEAALGITKE